MEYRKLLSITMDEKLRRPNSFHYNGEKCLDLLNGNSTQERVIIEKAHKIGDKVKDYFAGVSDNEGYVVGLRAVYEDSKEDSNPFSQNYYINKFRDEDEFVSFFVKHKESGYDNHINKKA